MVRQRADLEHQRLSEGVDEFTVELQTVRGDTPWHGIASASSLGCGGDAAAVRVQAWQPPPRRSRRRSSGGGSWRRRPMLLRVRVVVTDTRKYSPRFIAGMHISGKLFSRQTTIIIVLTHAGAIQRLRDEEAAAVKAEDFERAADLSAGLDAAGRDASTAATAAREAEAACESTSSRRIEVSSSPPSPNTAGRLCMTRPRHSFEHRCVCTSRVFRPECHWRCHMARDVWTAGSSAAGAGVAARRAGVAGPGGTAAG